MDSQIPLLNRLPFIKKLKWREVFCFRGLWGHLTSKNDPARLWEGLYVFPDSFYKLGGASYLEASAGVENIFKFLRIDYVWRLNYRENPSVQKKWNTVYVYDALHILMRIVHSQRALLLSSLSLFALHTKASNASSSNEAIPCSRMTALVCSASSVRNTKMPFPPKRKE